MSVAFVTHPWVEARRNRVGFGVQVATLPGDPQPSRTVVRAGQLAEELGLDAFFISDHPGYQTEPWLHLTAVAMTTERIGLGSVVNCVFHRHPVMLARLAADLDRLCTGRLVLGLGIGWNAAEFAQLGLDFPPVPARQEALAEAIQIVRGLWGAVPFTFAGKHWWTTEGHVAPPPVQRPGPPLMIAGGGERVTLRQVALHADACNFGAAPTTGRARSPAEVRRKLDVLRGYCEQIGRPFESLLRSHFTSWLMLSETEAGAQAKLDRYHPNGLTEPQRASRIYGTPKTAFRFYQSLADAGIDYFVVQIQDAADEETLRLLATAVAPLVKPGAR